MKLCGNCKHEYAPSNVEPCDSCDGSHNNWEEPENTPPTPDSEETRNLKIRRLIVGAEIELAGMVAQNRIQMANDKPTCGAYGELAFCHLNDQLTTAIKEVLGE